MGNKRIKHYDIAKGLGIILVVIGHSMIEFGHYIIYMFHMPLFFYLSGIFHKSMPFKESIIKHSFRLLIPLALFILITYGISICIHFDVSLVYDPPHLRGLVGPLWFLWALFIIVLFFNILDKCTLSNQIIISFALILSICGYVADKISLPNILYIFSCFSLLLFYAYGAKYGKRLTAIIYKYKIISFLTSLILLISMYVISYKYLHLRCNDLFSNTHTENYIVWILSAITGICLTISLSLIIEKYNALSTIIAFLGEYSINIFAFHLPVMTLMRSGFPFQSNLAELGIIGITIILSCLLRFPLHKLQPSLFK